MREASYTAGVASGVAQTRRLNTHLLSGGSENGEEFIFFIHGNASSGRFFEETLVALLDGYRGFAPDLRGFGGSGAEPVDATRGLADFSDDLAALSKALGLADRRIHLVGWFIGGTVALRYAMDRPGEVASLTLINSMSPYGFGGMKDVSGTPCWPDYAGSGGGTASPEFVGRLHANDRTEDDPNSPRNVMNGFYFAPSFRAPEDREEVFLTSVLSTQTGEDNYPGDMETTENWPGISPGERGVNNAISSRYCDLSGFSGIEYKPPVLWVRSDEDR